MNATKPLKRYLAALVLSPVVLFLSLLLFISVFEKRIPAPRISSSESFNEKARWLRNNLSSGCDVLVLGSSMALNSIDGNLVKRSFPGNSVINTASWGLSVAESRRLLQYVFPLCHPKVIIYPTYYGDFDNQWEKTINWSLFGEYVSRMSMIAVYVQSLDIKYYIGTSINRAVADRKVNRVYNSLSFDESGSVMLDSQNFEIDAVRWSGHEKYRLLNSGSVNENLSSLKEIAKISKGMNCLFVVVKTPLRVAAEKALAKPEIEELWRNVSKSVVAAGGAFVDVNSLGEFSDDQFSDFAHLNQNGARKQTELIIPVLKGSP